MDDKTKAIVAHITIIGWIISLVLNNQNKEELTSFYLRQLLGLFLAGLILSFIPVLGWILSIVIFVFWVLSLIGSIQGEKNLTPVIGEYFQQWFKAL